MHVVTTDDGGTSRRPARARARARKSGTIRTVRTAQSAATQALSSAATCDWGSSHELRRLAGAVLSPAAYGPTAIDIDGASSSYWQRAWLDDDRPFTFLDGADGRDATSLEDWRSTAARFAESMQSSQRSQIGPGVFGSAFENPPGIGGGDIVKQCWSTLDYLIEREMIRSLVWVGFNFDQMRSLIPGRMGTDGKFPVKNWKLHPLHATVTTIVPGRRISYLAHPKSMIEIMGKRMRSEKCKEAEKKRIGRGLAALRALIKAGDDSPVLGPSPTHASYVSIVWSSDSIVRRMQMLELRRFLDKAELDPRSAFHTYAIIGRQLDAAVLS